VWDTVERPQRAEGQGRSGSTVRAVELEVITPVVTLNPWVHTDRGERADESLRAPRRRGRTILKLRFRSRSVAHKLEQLEAAPAPAAS
jgi:hypothetical protein